MTIADNTEKLYELYEEFNNIRDELEDTITSFEVLQEDIRIALDDITGELEVIQEHLQKCSRMFRRFSSRNHKKNEIQPPV